MVGDTQIRNDLRLTTKPIFFSIAMNKNQLAELTKIIGDGWQVLDDNTIVKDGLHLEFKEHTNPSQQGRVSVNSFYIGYVNGREIKTRSHFVISYEKETTTLEIAKRLTKKLSKVATHHADSYMRKLEEIEKEVAAIGNVKVKQQNLSPVQIVVTDNEFVEINVRASVPIDVAKQILDLIASVKNKT